MSVDFSWDDPMAGWDDGWLDRHYKGAPDECDIHWPIKIKDGECPTCVTERSIQMFNKEEMDNGHGSFSDNGSPPF